MCICMTAAWHLCGEGRCYPDESRGPTEKMLWPGQRWAAGTESGPTPGSSKHQQAEKLLLCSGICYSLSLWSNDPIPLLAHHCLLMLTLWVSWEEIKTPKQDLFLLQTMTWEMRKMLQRALVKVASLRRWLFCSSAFWLWWCDDAKSSVDIQNIYWVLFVDAPSDRTQNSCVLARLGVKMCCLPSPRPRGVPAGSSLANTVLPRNSAWVAAAGGLTISTSWQRRRSRSSTAQTCIITPHTSSIPAPSPTLPLLHVWSWSSLVWALTGAMCPALLMAPQSRDEFQETWK